MSDTSRLRVGIIGAGGIVRQRHLPGLKKLGVEVVAVANRTEASGRKVAAEWDIPDVHADWRELVARDDLHAVFIGTWPYMHCPVTLAALEAGKHVFCQARMAMNLTEARDMLRASMRTDRVTMLCPPPHGLKGDRVMRRLMSEGLVGRIRLARLTSLSDALADPEAPLSWRQDRRCSGHNVLTLGIYAEVLHRWLGYARRLSAQMSTFITERRLPGNDEVVPVEIPDCLSAVAKLESGAELTIAMSGVVPHGPEDTLEIFGDRGGLIYNFAQDTITGCKGDGPWQEIPITPAEEQPWTVEADFIEAVRAVESGKQAPAVHPDFHDGYKYMEFVEAVWQSDGQRRQIDLPMAV